MNKSKRTISSRSSRSKNTKVADEEIFDFKFSPSPKRRFVKRETTVVSKKEKSTISKKVANKVSPELKERRKSFYLKRLETDMSDNISASNIRRTRRQSMACIPKAVAKTSKTQIPRAKSEKSIPREVVSKSKVSSPTRQIDKNADTKKMSKVKKILSSPKEDIKILSKSKKKSSVAKEELKKNKSKSDAKLIKSPLSKDNFYSKSPLKTRQTVTQKLTIQINRVKRNEILSPKKSPQEIKKNSPPKQKSPPKTKANTPVLKKPVKRLSVSTPSPRQINTKRLTRSAAKKTKKVQIFAQSPSFNADFRKTPRVIIADGKKTSGSPISTKSKLNPFTPKPEEPLKILKLAIKKNIAAEMRNLDKFDVSEFARPSIATVKTPARVSSSMRTPTKVSSSMRTPTKVSSSVRTLTKMSSSVRSSRKVTSSVRTPTKVISSVRTPTKTSSSLRIPTKASSSMKERSPPKRSSPVKITINGTTPTKNGIHHDGSFSVSYNMPATPLSSRKASFRRYRGSVRLPNNEDALDYPLNKSSATDKPLSSTPVRSKPREVSFRDEYENEELMDISEFSTSAEESNHASYNNGSYGFSTHSVEELKETTMEKSVEQPAKKSFCSLM